MERAPESRSIPNGSSACLCTRAQNFGWAPVVLIEAACIRGICKARFISCNIYITQRRDSSISLSLSFSGHQKMIRGSEEKAMWRLSSVLSTRKTLCCLSAGVTSSLNASRCPALCHASVLISCILWTTIPTHPPCSSRGAPVIVSASLSPVPKPLHLQRAAHPLVKRR